jgi:hypothetical protein
MRSSAAVTTTTTNSPKPTTTVFAATALLLLVFARPTQAIGQLQGQYNGPYPDICPR